MYTDYAAIARAYGVEGIKVDSASEFKPALEREMEDVALTLEPLAGPGASDRP